MAPARGGGIHPLITTGTPARAPSIDLADAGTKSQPPRSRRGGIIARRMWTGIAFVGAAVAGP